MARRRIFSWRMILRYVAYGAAPLALAFVLAEAFFGRTGVGGFFLALALVLPFVALAWLAYQHFRKRP